MRRFANFFLILFLADGIVSFLNEMLVVYPNTTLLSGIRCISSWAVIAVSIPFYVCLGIDKRLPKAIFLPQLMFVFWSVFQLWPLPVMLDRTGYALPMAFGQILLGAFPLLYFRINTKKHLLLPPEMFSSPFFKLKHTVLFFVVHLAMLPLILIYMAVAVASLQLDKKTGGYACLRPDGMHMVEKIYRRDNKEIRLASMIHIADKAYFDDVIESIPSQGTIVLAEGISDRYHQLATRFSYGELARNLGLTSQENMAFQGKLIEAVDIPHAASTAENGVYHIIRADIDIDDFNPKTIEFMKIIGSTLLSDTSISEGMRTYFAWVRENSPHFTPQIIMNDILYRRNQEVINHMESVLAHYDTIIIPWGALHMPGIEAAVLHKGFLLFNTRERIGIDFKKMLHAHLFN
jgi:hypothetical protein